MLNQRKFFANVKGVPIDSAGTPNIFFEKVHCEICLNKSFRPRASPFSLEISRRITYTSPTLLLLHQNLRF